MSTIRSLEDGVMMDILSRLSAKCLMRCKCVCKPLQTLITSPCFLKLHLQIANDTASENIVLEYDKNTSIKYYYSLDIDACNEVRNLELPEPGVVVVGSCNGLLCLSDSKTSASLWNPTTKEYVKLLNAPSLCRQQLHLKMVFGFGFINTTKEYKVLRCVYSKLRISEVNVYTVGTGSWKTVDVILLHEAQDIWKELSMFRDVMSSRVEIWSMKDYGVKESWTKFFSIAHPGVLDPYDCVIKPLAIRKNGDVLVLMNHKYLFSYCRTRNGIVEYHNVHGIPDWFSKRYSHMEALTSMMPHP
ncbi:hypothetical protein GIB67_014473 [Kingdonia uniflora]|uniref:F-box domain-containing protein n=1 Tax=Kingdonia uniflora TaxID=39325 RepID=A0A7J7LZ56_9MAGN|nr:hypothetical protein GIB67_014473 [Kingdonia uniflora]